jgi:predicted nucleic acid-binding protein
LATALKKESRASAAPIAILPAIAILFYQILRLVLGATVFVAAVRSDVGASRQLLRAGLESRYQLLATVTLMIEYQAVLTREEHLIAAGLSTAQMTALLDAVSLVAEPVRTAFLWRPLLGDADDDMVLEAAINGDADALVTFNTRDFVGATRFGLAVLTPREALAEVERKA